MKLSRVNSMLDRIASALETLTGRPGVTDDEFEGVAITDSDGVLI
jgi:hypothetical protein